MIMVDCKLYGSCNQDNDFFTAIHSAYWIPTLTGKASSLVFFSLIGIFLVFWLQNTTSTD
jgi:hypothetical protein